MLLGEKDGGEKQEVRLWFVVGVKMGCEANVWVMGGLSYVKLRCAARWNRGHQLWKEDLGFRFCDGLEINGGEVSWMKGKRRESSGCLQEG